MLTRTRPDESFIARYLVDQADLAPTYPSVGSTVAGSLPAGWPVGRRRLRVGAGDSDYAAARDAVLRWRMFEIGWLRLCWPTTKPEVGATVAILTRIGLLWSLNACRVVVTVDEVDARRRTGFAYGTLPDHMERGEELFVVEQEPNGDVWFEVVAFSKPHHPLARALAPGNRLLQRRFRRDACVAMMQAVTEHRSEGGT